MNFILGVITGIIISGCVVIFILYCISLTGEDVAVYKNKRILVKGKNYPVIGEVPFWNGERVTGRYEIRKINGVKYAAYITNNN